MNMNMNRGDSSTSMKSLKKEMVEVLTLLLKSSSSCTSEIEREIEKIDYFSILGQIQSQSHEV